MPKPISAATGASETRKDIRRFIEREICKLDSTDSGDRHEIVALIRVREFIGGGDTQSSMAERANAKKGGLGKR
jgi:hypothetical protein